MTRQNRFDYRPDLEFNSSPRTPLYPGSPWAAPTITLDGLDLTPEEIERIEIAVNPDGTSRASLVLYPKARIKLAERAYIALSDADRQDFLRARSDDFYRYFIQSGQPLRKPQTETDGQDSGESQNESLRGEPSGPNAAHPGARPPQTPE